MSVVKELQNQVREWRKARGLRQQDLAREAGVTRQTIIAIEKGRLNPSVYVCLRIAKVLQEPVEKLFCLARPEEEESAVAPFQITPAFEEGAPAAEAGVLAQEEETPSGGFWDFV